MLGGAAEHSGGWDTHRAALPCITTERKAWFPSPDRDLYTEGTLPRSRADVCHLPRWGQDPSQPVCPRCVPLLAENGSAWLDSETRIYTSHHQDKGLCKNTGSRDVLTDTPAGYRILHLSQSGRPHTHQRCHRPRRTCAGPQPLLMGELQAVGGLLGK